MTRKLTPDLSCSIGGVKMADQGAADPGNNNNNKPEASEGTIIKVTVKTPKDKEEIAIAEDASVTQVGGFHRRVLSGAVHRRALTSCPCPQLQLGS